MEALAPSPQTTLVLLLGASEWPFMPEFQRSEAFANAARRLRAYFLNIRPFGLPPENLLDLFDSEKSADEMDVTIGQFIQDRLAALKADEHPARDLLLYFIGHGGFVGRDADFYLAIRRTRMDNPRASGLQMLSLADTLTEQARSLRRLIILDCCFAAAAFSAFQSGPAQVAVEKTVDAFEVRQKAAGFATKGTTLLCSSSHKSPSLLLPDGSSTMFTKAFLDALVYGTPSQRDRLTLRDVKERATDLLYAIRNAPKPVVHSPDQSEGDVADIPFFPNPRIEEERFRKAEEEKRRRAEEEQTRQAEVEQRRRAKEEDIPQAEKRPMREAEPDKDSTPVSPSLSSLKTTEATTILPGKPIERYLLALAVGGIAGVLNFPFVHMVSTSALGMIIPGMISLFAGFITGKIVVIRTAGLLTGLVIGVSLFAYVSSWASQSSSFNHSSDLVIIFIWATVCALLSWFASWFASRKHAYYLSHSSKDEGR